MNLTYVVEQSKSHLTVTKNKIILLLIFLIINYLPDILLYISYASQDVFIVLLPFIDVTNIISGLLHAPLRLLLCMMELCNPGPYLGLVIVTLYYYLVICILSAVNNSFRSQAN